MPSREEWHSSETWQPAWMLNDRLWHPRTPLCIAVPQWISLTYHGLINLFHIWKKNLSVSSNLNQKLTRKNMAKTLWAFSWSTLSYLLVSSIFGSCLGSHASDHALFLKIKPTESNYCYPYVHMWGYPLENEPSTTTHTPKMTPFSAAINCQ